LDQARRQKWEKEEAAKTKAEERKREKAENAEENKKKQVPNAYDLIVGFLLRFFLLRSLC